MEERRHVHTKENALLVTLFVLIMGVLYIALFVGMFIVAFRYTPPSPEPCVLVPEVAAGPVAD